MYRFSNRHHHVCVCAAALGMVVVLAACAPPAEMPVEPEPEVVAVNPLREFGIIANNVFFYYDDVEQATEFYRDTLGLSVVVDYGFAKILRVADTSYITLVDAAEGIHSTDEPKAIAIALVTDQLDEWHAYLTAQGVEMRGSYTPTETEGRPHDGFVAYDPEGYYLEFERFNPHPENARLMPVLDATQSLGASGDGVPEGLGFKATILWAYYDDMEAIQRFYEEKLGFELIVDQGWAKIYQTSSTGYFGLVDGERGMHQATPDKAVTVSFLTEDVRGWFEYVRDQDVFELRTQELTSESDRVDVFVGYDLEHYFLEFDTFVEHPDNATLLEQLRGQ